MIYQQELAALRQSVQNLHENEKQLIPKIDEREKALWSSFHKSQQEEGGEPEYILQNDAYIQMVQAAASSAQSLTFTPGPPNNARGSKIGGSIVSAGPFEFAGNIPLRSGGIGSTMPRHSTLEMPLQIQHDEPSMEEGGMRETQNEIEDELMKLRRENELLKASLMNKGSGVQQPNKQAQNYAKYSALRTQQPVFRSSDMSNGNGFGGRTSNPYEKNLYKSAQKMSNGGGSNIYIGDGINGRVQYEEGSGIIEERTGQLSQSKAKVFTVSPIREDYGVATMSFTQRDIEDPSSHIMMNGGGTLSYQDPGSATAGFHKHHQSMDALTFPLNEGGENGLSPMRTYMEQTQRHRENRLREQEYLQASEVKTRQYQHAAMTQTAIKTFQEQLQQHSAASQPQYVPYFLDVPSYQQQIYRDYVIDYNNYLRRVSKYDLDRGTLDYHRLRQEKEKDRTENVKIKKRQWEKGLAHKKKREAEEKKQKLEYLEAIRMRQAIERQEFLRRQQEQFRKAIEERTNNGEKGSQYMISQTSSGKGIPQQHQRSQESGGARQSPQEQNRGRNDDEVEEVDEAPEEEEEEEVVESMQQLNVRPHQQSHSQFQQHLTQQRNVAAIEAADESEGEFGDRSEEEEYDQQE